MSVYFYSGLVYDKKNLSGERIGSFDGLVQGSSAIEAYDNATQTQFKSLRDSGFVASEYQVQFLTFCKVE